MTTHVTYKPHYCDKRYGEYVADKIYHMRLFGIPRNIPIISNILIGRLNSLTVPEDSRYLCNGAFELYPIYYRKPNAKIVTMMKELTFWLFDSFPSYKRNFIKKLFSLNTGIITDTEMMKSLIEKQMNVHIEVVNPFCAQPFLENKPNLEEKRLMFIGSFESPNKGYRELVEAFRMLKKTDNAWEIFMIGKKGTSVIKHLIEGLQVTNYVPSLKPYFSRCSIYVHPAYFEPFGITVLEAMSAGVIPIVTKATGSSEVLEKNGMSSLIVEDNNPETLTQKIVEVYNYSAAKKKKISVKCKSIVKKDYLEEKGVKQFKRAFDVITNS